MASFSVVLLAVTLFVATNNTAPQNKNLDIKIPDECGPGFCSIRPEGYDKIEEKINKLLPSTLIAVGDRDGETKPYFVPETDEDNCPSDIKTELPHIYKDSENPTKVDLIVQTKLFPQQFENIICKNNTGGHNVENQECFSDLGLSKGFNLKFRCQPSYGMRTLLVYDPDKDNIVTKNYPITVCCSCQITIN